MKCLLFATLISFTISNAVYADTLKKTSFKPDIVVSKDVNKSGQKTKGETWYSSIQEAFNAAKPGDLIYIKKGIYQEFLTFKKSGRASGQITLMGEIGKNGKYETIIDPSIKLDEWQNAPEIGSGVYKIQIPFEPSEITVDGKRIGKINDKKMSNGEGLNILAWDSRYQIFSINGNRKIKFWDGIEALFGCINGMTYIKFRDDDNPNNKSIMASPSGAVITIKNQRYITIKDLLIRNAERCIDLTGRNCSNINIIECYLKNGRKRILINNGANNILVRNNTITMDYIASNFLGAGQEKGAYDSAIKRHVYNVFKWIISNSASSDDIGIELFNAGKFNLIKNNVMTKGLIGIYAKSNTVINATDKLDATENTISSMSSVGIVCDDGVFNFKIAGNKIYDCNINIRLHEINSRKNIGRRIFIHNNKLSNPKYMGVHFFAFASSKEAPLKFPEIYIYNNNISGGITFMAMNDSVIGSGGLPSTYIFNNLISAPNPSYPLFLSVLEKHEIGLFSNNWVGGCFKSDTIKFYHESNIVQNGVFLWKIDEPFPTDISTPSNIKSIKTGGLNITKYYNENKDAALPTIFLKKKETKAIPLGVTINSE